MMGVMGVGVWCCSLRVFHKPLFVLIPENKYKNQMASHRVIIKHL